MNTIVGVAPFTVLAPTPGALDALRVYRVLAPNVLGVRLSRPMSYVDALQVAVAWIDEGAEGVQVIPWERS